MLYTDFLDLNRQLFISMFINTHFKRGIHLKGKKKRASSGLC